MDLWWGESTGGTLPGGEGMSEFLGSGGGAPPFPQVEEILLSPPSPQKSSINLHYRPNSD